MSNKYASTISSHKFLTDSSFPRQPVSTLLRKRMIRKAANPNSWPQSVDDVLFSDQLWKRKDIELLLRNPAAIRYIPEKTIHRIAGAIGGNAMSYRDSKTNQLARDLVNQWDFLSSQPFEPIIYRKQNVEQLENPSSPVRRAATMDTKENIMAPQSLSEYMKSPQPVVDIELDDSDFPSRARLKDAKADRRRKIYNSNRRYQDRVDALWSEYYSDQDRHQRGKLSKPPTEPKIPPRFKVRSFTPEQKRKMYETRISQRNEDRRLNAAYQERIKNTPVLSDVPYGPELPPKLQQLAKDPIAWANWQRNAEVKMQREAQLLRAEKESGVDPNIRARENMRAGNVNPYSSPQPYSTSSYKGYGKGATLVAIEAGFTKTKDYLDYIDTLPKSQRQQEWDKVNRANQKTAGMKDSEYRKLRATARNKYLGDTQRMVNAVRADLDAPEPTFTGQTGTTVRSARSTPTSAPTPTPAPTKEERRRRAAEAIARSFGPKPPPPPKEYSLTRLARFGSAKAKQMLNRKIRNTSLEKPIRMIGNAINRIPRKAKIGALSFGAGLLAGNALMNKRATIAKSATVHKKHHNKYF